jgi:ribosome assembly protein YihI (activator of Der GTPase)
MKKNSKDPKILSIKKKAIPLMMLNQVKKEKKTNKKPKPNTWGHDRPF